jgi:Cu2+-exporting ATPase
LGAGLITFLVWSLLGDIDEAITRTVTVLVISCPHALGLAIPLVVSISTSLAARNGMLIRNRMALERMRQVSVVLFDKTGTLTEGRPEVSGVATVDANVTEQGLIAMAAAAEIDSEHPLARAVVDYAAARKIVIPRASGFEAIAGHGVQAKIGAETIQVGGPAMLGKAGLQSPASLRNQEAEWAARGATVLHVVRGGVVIGALALTDAIRPESRESVTALRRDGVEVAMMTGDSADVAQAVASELGITQVMAGILPDGKQAEVVRLQQGGKSVAMVGDGVNDAPALAQADVGIAIGAGTDVAIASAGVVLASSDPRTVVSIRVLSAATYRKMTQNLAWAVGYNVIAIPLAAGVLGWAGVVVSPAIGAVMMSLSTIIVALNAQLLRRLPLHPTEVRP